FFFFSSRRRHTRCLSDWSSDVCSSDLPPTDGPATARPPARPRAAATAAPVAIPPRRVPPSPLLAPEEPMARARRMADAGRLDEEIGRASCRERVESVGGGGSVEEQRTS